jgi:hypothetical protein
MPASLPADIGEVLYVAKVMSYALPGIAPGLRFNTAGNWMTMASCLLSRPDTSKFQDFLSAFWFDYPHFLHPGGKGRRF